MRKLKKVYSVRRKYRNRIFNINQRYRYHIVHFTLIYKNLRKSIRVNRNQTYLIDYIVTHNR
jgi:hypothetical protein